jgi:hypothetical protein
MPVNENINRNIHRMHELVECDPFRLYTLHAVVKDTGQRITRTFPDYYSLEAWLSTYQATSYEILNIT